MKYFIYIFSVFAIITSATGALPKPRHFSVPLTAKADSTGILLEWEPDSFAVKYIISKKIKGENFFKQLTTLKPPQYSFFDKNIEKGIHYEYQVQKEGKYWLPDTSIRISFDGFGYISSGFQAPAVDNSGKLLLLIDHTLENPLAAEISRFKDDLISEGWEVSVKYVPRAEKFSRHAVETVKKIVKKEYEFSGKKLRTIILLGRVPVPYAGLIGIDGHLDHFGAWPTDSYYTDVDGEWTDTSSSLKNLHDMRNLNQPYDGKLDENYIPTKVEIESGRIDFYNLKSLKKSEVELLRNYLNKNHDYRTKKLVLRKRALIADAWQVRNTSSKEASAAGTWSDFTALVGKDSVSETDISIREKVKKDSYLFTFMGHNGGSNSVQEMAYTEDYDKTDFRVGFAQFFGSWNPDWDFQDGLLRGALASSPYSVATMWVGRPYWHLHTMGMGETIGYSAKLTINDVGQAYYDDYSIIGGSLIHINLMGDPTLELIITAPPKNAKTKKENGSTLITWDAAEDKDILGYNIYKAKDIESGFKKIGFASKFEYKDNEDSEGIYLIRTLKLEESVSGTYYNLSSGVFAKP